MSQAVTVYRWDDAGAPQLTNQKPSEIIDILTKCLVDGYGTKDPLGWTRPYYDAATRAVVFRNNIAAGGSGGYTKIYSNDLTDNNNAVMRLTHAASMSDINSFFNQGFTQAFSAAAGAGASKRDKWVLIGTPLAFYFFILINSYAMNQGGSYQPTIFTGDIYSALANDAGRFITVVNPSQGDIATTTGQPTLQTLATGQVGVTVANLKIYDADGHTTSNGYTVYNPAPKVEFTAQAGFAIDVTSEHILFPCGVVRQNYDIDAATTDRLGVLAHVSNVSPSFRGVLPGLGFSLKPGFQGFSGPVIREINTHDHLLFISHSTGPCNMWLNMEVWSDPFGNV